MDNDSDLVLLGPGDAQDFNPGHILPQPAETIADIRAWLRPTSYNHETGEYRKHLASLEEGTGAWFTETEAYREWHDGHDKGLLLVTGVPGSGKSVLAAKLVQDLMQEDARAPVLYFFFRQIVDANQTPAAVVRDWLDQILAYSPPLQQALTLDIDHTVETDDLWKHLRMALADLPDKAYCIIDALDEMDRARAKNFLKELADLGRFMPEKVKVLATSRPLPEVTDVLRSGAASQVRLDAEMVDLDISSYVRRQLETSEIPLKDQARLHEAITGRANGLFIYARLALEAFMQPGAHIGDVMARLPADLNMIYTNLLEVHANRSGTPADIQHLILQAASHATRPLRLLEMADMVRAAYPSLVPDSMAAVKDMIRGACGPILEILPNETVSVIHHTFTEYLKGTARTNSAAGYPILNLSETHVRLARVCMDYLSNTLDTLADKPIHSEAEDEVQDGSLTLNSMDKTVASLRLKFTFLEYAATNWGRHVSRADLAAQAQLNERIDAIFQKPQFRRHGVQLWWLCKKYELRASSMYHGSVDYSFVDHNRWDIDEDSDHVLYGSTHLHMAARLGLAAYAGYNVGDPHPGHPPMWATPNHHTAISTTSLK